jgi:leucyl-tRNA synthetase
MPIDQYIGGSEHATGHLIYFRFYTKLFRDLKLLNFDEPTQNLFNQGMIHKDGFVMSKSRGNIVDPIHMIKKYGADTLRLYFISNSSPDKDLEWSDKGIQGAFRFINKVMHYFSKPKFKSKSKADAKLESKLHKTIKEVTQDIKEFKYNLAVIKLRALFDYLKEIDKKTAEVFLKLLHPFCPHITEELWHKWNKSFISLEKWPKYDEKKINKKFEKQEENQEKLKDDVRNIIRIIKKKPSKIFIYVIPKEKELYSEVVNDIGIELSCKVEIFASNKATYDPKGKAKKAKPGKPAIYVE